MKRRFPLQATAVTIFVLIILSMLGCAYPKSPAGSTPTATAPYPPEVNIPGYYTEPLYTCEPRA